VAAVRQHCRPNHFEHLSAALNLLTVCVCSCSPPAQRFQIHVGTFARYNTFVSSACESCTRWLSLALLEEEHGQLLA
jgi:hypothetical protein